MCKQSNISRERTNHWSIYNQGILIGTLYEITVTIHSINHSYIEHEIELEKSLLNSFRLIGISNLGDENGYINPENTEVFYSERVVPKTRVNIDKILEDAGLSEYDAWALFRMNYGRVTVDYTYVDFDNHGNGEHVLKDWQKYFPRLNPNYNTNL